MRGRRRLAQTLMWAVLIVVAPETIEAHLLRGLICGRRGGGFRFQGAMHALMAAVLLGLAWIDSLQRNSGLKPFHRQPRKSRGAGRRERFSIIGADRAWAAEAVKGLLEQWLYLLVAGSNDAAFKQITAIGIGDGERITALAVGSAKPAREVGAP